MNRGAPMTRESSVTVFERNGGNRRRAVTVARSTNSRACAKSNSLMHYVYSGVVVTWCLCFPLFSALAPFSLCVRLRYTRRDRTTGLMIWIWFICRAHGTGKASFVGIIEVPTRSHNRISIIRGCPRIIQDWCSLIQLRDYSIVEWGMRFSARFESIVDASKVN